MTSRAGDTHGVPQAAMPAQPHQLVGCRNDGSDGSGVCHANLRKGTLVADQPTLPHVDSTTCLWRFQR
ncbi:hypothetical protein KCP76_16875 [Salmonella enterica subsp. enterica serovar Weltevreden]|nr:hypothetical protein KCP76_16875 [Salmonella enterica subsp. enterica serovar Weltevreden]